MPTFYIFDFIFSFLSLPVAFSSLGYTSFYLFGKLHCFNQIGRGYLWRLLVGFTPVFLALIVALSRTCDYHHHWQGKSIISFVYISIIYMNRSQAFQVYHTPFKCLPILIPSLT